MPKFERGNPGRPPGIPNKPNPVKEAIQQFLEKNIDQVQESFDQLEPLQKLQFIANILPYAIPKQASIQADTREERTVILTFKDAE